MKTNEEIKQLPNLLIFGMAADGGAAELWRAGRKFGTVIWSNGGGWEHVSLCPYKHSHTPTWDEMCDLKDMFFNDDEVVIQIHPKKSEYVNNVKNCLHLWRPINANIQTPPSIMVGLKDGETAAEARAAADNLMPAT